MVLARVHTVDTDGIDTEFLEERNVTLAGSTVRKGVDESRGLGEGVVRIGREFTFVDSVRIMNKIGQANLFAHLVPGKQYP